MKISENVESIDGTMAHSYSISSGGKLFLVDAGTKGSGRKIAAYYRNLGKEPDYILITHYHMDHIGGLNILMENFSSKVYVPSDEIDFMAGKKGYPDGTPTFLKLFTRIPRIDWHEKLNPSESLQVPGVTVVDTKGHTPGSTSYLFTEEGVLCVGDALYSKRGSLEINSMFSLDMGMAVQSREKILQFKPVMILPGHGDPVRI